MNSKRQTLFIHSAAVILFMMAAGQIFAVAGIPSLVNHVDTILGLSLRQTFFCIAGAELAVSAFLLAGNNPRYKLNFIAWLILDLIVYQWMLWWSGLPNYLSCLGNLNDNFPVPPEILNGIMFLFCGYCLAGSCAFMTWNWWENRKAITPKEGEQIQTA